MLEGGADIRFIQALLGHERREATQIYTKVSIGKLVEVHAACRARIQAATSRAGGRYVFAGVATQVDSPVPGPGDAAGAIIAVGTTGLLLWDIGKALLASEPYKTPGGTPIRDHGRQGNGREYIGGKGWTPDDIDSVLDEPAEKYPGKRGDHRTGHGTKVYVDKDGNFVVVNEETGEVIQVNDRNNPRQTKPEPREGDEGCNLEERGSGSGGCGG